MQTFCHRRRPGIIVNAGAQDRKCSELTIVKMHVGGLIMPAADANTIAVLYWNPLT